MTTPAVTPSTGYTYLGQPYPTLQPSPIEAVAEQALPWVLSQQGNLTTNVATRRPRQQNSDDMYPGGFVRIESAGGRQVNEIQFEQDLVLNTYFESIPPLPSDEFTAEKLAGQITGIAGNGLGLYVILEDGSRWDINDSRVAILPTRQTDPMVNITRYRSMVTWTTTGKPIDREGNN